jgi:hypothetical protein
MTPASLLRLNTVKVGHTQAELAALDTNRGHYGRAEFLRAAGQEAVLQAAPGEVLAQTLSTTARIQSCFFHINDHATVLNTIRLSDGPEAAARELLARSGQILKDFTEFRAAVFGAEEA